MVQETQEWTALDEDPLFLIQDPKCCKATRYTSDEFLTTTCTTSSLISCRDSCLRRKKGWVTSSGVQRMDMAMKMGDLDGFRMDLGQWYLEGCLSLPLTFNIYLGWRIQSYWHLSYEMKPSNWFHVMLVNVGLFAVTSSSTCPNVQM